MNIVFRAQYVCSWKPEYQLIRVSSPRVISWIEQKKEFCRSELEKALDLNEGQAYWFIKDLIKNKVIKRTKRFVQKVGKGQRQVIYKFIK